MELLDKDIPKKCKSCEYYRHASCPHDYTLRVLCWHYKLADRYRRDKDGSND